MSGDEEVLPLPAMTGGINRFELEAGQDQVIDGLDIWLRDGTLQRRPAFEKIQAAAPYRLPGGMCGVIVTIIGTSATEYADRNPQNLSIPQIGSTLVTGNIRIFVGCSIPFDGIEWAPLVRGAGFVPTQHTKLYPRYWDNNGNPQRMFGVVDTTLSHEEDGVGNAFYIPLLKEGRISWRKSDFVNWTAQSLAGSTVKYWVSLDMVSNVDSPDFGVQTLSPIGGAGGTLSLNGVRCFLLNPINGLYSSRCRGGVPIVLAGNDFPTRRANLIQGGGLGIHKTTYEPIEVARVVEQEGTGISGAPNQPLWAGGTAADPNGAANAITDPTQSWIPNQSGATATDTGQFSGSAVLTVTPNAAGSVTGIPLNLNWNFNYDINFEGHRARVVAQPGPGGPAVGTEREIIGGNGVRVDVYPNWPTGLSGNETIEIRRPNAQVRTREAGADYEVASNTATRLSLSTQPYSRVPFATPDNGAYVNYEIYRESFWSLLRGYRWSFAYDSVSGVVIMTNGENGLLEYDGVRVRRLKALWDTTPGVEGADLVQSYTGVLVDSNPKLNSLVNQGSLLHRIPPNGLYVVDFNGRIVVANLKDRPQTVRWSGPGAVNNVWPTINEALVRDASNNPITGLASLLDRLVVFTQTQIFIADQPDASGLFFFRAISHGVGFVSHFAVVRVAFGQGSYLIGVAPDGLYLFNGFDPKAVLDHWRRLLPDGVNDRMLYISVAAAWYQENLAFFAVPSAGSEVNDRLIVWDWKRDIFWVWSAPYGGVTAITREFDESGRERMLFGHVDGHISTLSLGVYDGATAPVGYARCKTLRVDRRTRAWKAAFITFEVIGSDKTVNVTPYVNRQPRTFASAAPSLTIDGVGADAHYGADNYNVGRYGSPQQRTYRVMWPQGNSQGEAFEFEVRGSTRWKYIGGDLLYTDKGYRQP